MEYRKMGRNGEKVSLLGMGCMRFPTDSKGAIDRIQAEKMIEQAMDSGVNYYDTAYKYHNGESEPFLGEVLSRYERSSYYLATKLPVWLIEDAAHAREVINQQMQRLRTEYFDFYLLHAIDAKEWKKVQELGLLDVLEEFRTKGVIRNLGFSFHDSYEVFEEILTSRSWDFCQIQYNYMDIEEQAGDKGYALAEMLDIPLVVMEPVKGGALAELPEDLAAPMKRKNPHASLASWALRWAASHPQVKLVLSGMSSQEQIADNLRTLGGFEPLTSEELEITAWVRKEIFKRQKSPCTGCSYCMPCPFGVDIPQNFSAWNKESMYGPGKGSQVYRQLAQNRQDASCCQSCHKCEKVCPQHISIAEELKKVQDCLGEFQKA